METASVLLTKNALLLFFLISFYSLSVQACDGDIAEAGNNDLYVVGYVNHPRVISYYRPLIERAYRDIGKDIKFESVGGEKGLRLLNEGMTDADVIRYDVVAEDGSNIIIVPPALSQGASYLLCIRGAECGREVINNPDKAIAVTTRFFFNMGAKPAELNANIFEFDDFHHVVYLLLSGRFDYAILPSDHSEESIFKQSGVEVVPLVEHRLVHVINKKHAYLMQSLSAAIAKQLNLQSSLDK
ncbi:hypothetical protein [Alteromonas gracilis]|uniref:hypothetical protein n=1 Tax=Alteromonas gracilis TaxID=1479524 RepID=UPI0037365EE5